MTSRRAALSGNTSLFATVSRCIMQWSTLDTLHASSQNVIRDKWRNVDDHWSDNEKRYFAIEKAFGSSSKAEWRTYSAHFLLISLTDDYCDDLT